MGFAYLKRALNRVSHLEVQEPSTRHDRARSLRPNQHHELRHPLQSDEGRLDQAGSLLAVVLLLPLWVSSGQT